MSTTDDPTGRRVAIREGLLSGDLARLDTVKLQGARCRHCHEVTLGANRTCPNCGGTEVEVVPLSDHGELWTYTVVRHKPPGDYRGPEPFEPFCLGLVELPDGLRVLSPVEGDVDAMKIGMPLRLKVSVHHTGANGEDVVAFAFVPRH
jgi:uncharacterized protein